jgi:magnesium-transporting ATPase (P-type)
VRLVSGDNLLTAVEAARNSRILEPEEERHDMVCMEGKDFRDLVGGVKKVQDAKGNVVWQVNNLPNFKAIA